jgi:hypothetical protein
MAILLLYVPVKGPPLQKPLSTKEEKLTPRLSHVHDTSHTSSVEPVSLRRKVSCEAACNPTMRRI